MEKSEKPYEKYSGKFDANIYIDPVKACHQHIKNNLIKLFSANSDLLIDIGSGRGHDYSSWGKNMELKK